MSIDTRHAFLIACALLAPASVPHADTTPAEARVGARGFDFLVGEWRVRHRRIPAGGGDWVEFDGTLTLRLLMQGTANVEEHVMNYPGRPYRAIGLRSWDAKSGQWSIWWLDERYPSGPIGPPVQGGFSNGVGAFYADYVQDGKPMRGRFIWSEITPTSARWEQAASADGGKTWQPNWIMRLTRETPAAAAADAQAASPPELHDFDFLAGEWRVRHRYLRVTAEGTQWTETEGTCSHRPFTSGWANLEEHVIDAPAGAYRAVALRSYDAKAGQWAIWWLDGRDPARTLDPPMKGRFENGVGTFHGQLDVNGKATPVRFIWSRITPASAQWEQAYSSDGGRTWETNWIMEFQRMP